MYMYPYVVNKVDDTCRPELYITYYDMHIRCVSGQLVATSVVSNSSHKQHISPRTKVMLISQLYCT